MKIWMVTIVVILVLVAAIVAFLPTAVWRDELRRLILFSVVVITVGFFLYLFSQSEYRYEEAAHERNLQRQTISQLALELKELKIAQTETLGFEDVLTHLTELTTDVRAKDSNEFSAAQIKALEFKLNSLMNELARIEKTNSKQATVAYSRPQPEKKPSPQSRHETPPQKKPMQKQAQIEEKSIDYQPEYRVMLATVAFAGENTVVPLMTKTGRPLSLFDGDVIEYISTCDPLEPNTSIDGGIYPGISKRGVKPIRELALKTAFEKHVLEAESGRLIIRGPAGRRLDVIVSNPMRYKDCEIKFNIATTRGHSGG